MILASCPSWWSRYWPLPLSGDYLVNDLVVNHIKKERLGQQCVRIQVKHIFYDFSKVVLPSPGPGEKWQRLPSPCHLYTTTSPALWGRVFLFVKPPCLCICFFFTSRVTKRIHFCIHFAFISEKKSKFSGWEKGRLESKWDFRTGPFSDNLSKESGPELLLGRHEKLSVCEKILHSYFLFKT